MCISNAVWGHWGVYSWKPVVHLLDMPLYLNELRRQTLGQCSEMYILNTVIKYLVFIVHLHLCLSSCCYKLHFSLPLQQLDCQQNRPGSYSDVHWFNLSAFTTTDMHWFRPLQINFLFPVHCPHPVPSPASPRYSYCKRDSCGGGLVECHNLQPSSAALKRCCRGPSLS